MKTVYEDAKDTAKKIRKELKAAFPGMKFSVRTKHSSVRVEWVNGPTQKEVEAVADKFSSSTFDGMQDMKITTGYEYEGVIYSGADFVFCNRELTPEYRAEVHAEMKRTMEDFSNCEEENDFYSHVNYHHWFKVIESEMIAKENEVEETPAPAAEEAPAETPSFKVVDNRGEIQGKGYNLSTPNNSPDPDAPKGFDYPQHWGHEENDEQDKNILQYAADYFRKIGVNPEVYLSDNWGVQDFDPKTKHSLINIWFHKTDCNFTLHLVGLGADGKIYPHQENLIQTF